MTQTSFRVAFREWFGLTPIQADVLVTLYAASGAALTAPCLAKLLRTTAGNVQTRVSEIRKSLESEAIDTDAAGYRLTETGMAECRAALWTMGEELRRAS